MKEINVVCALIIKDNKVFCCKRGLGKALEGFWEFPGGKIELNETKEKALIREIKEELNSIIEPVEFVMEVNYQYYNMAPYEDFKITLYAYYAKLVSGQLELSEHTESLWATIEDLKNLNFAKADEEIIKFLIKKLSN